MNASIHNPEITAYLKQDTLKHIVQLKALAVYARDVQAYHFTAGAAAGVMFLLPTRVMAYESVKYPQTEYVILISTDAASVSKKMLAHIPANCNLLFKFTNQHDLSVIKEKFPLQRVTSFISYTCPNQAFFPAAKQVIVSAQPDEALLSMFRQNGYEREEVMGYFKSGAFNVALYQNKKPVSACLAYRNYENIWEIAGLYTSEEKRRQGLAIKVVQTALNTLLEKGYIPRYQMDEKNIASKELAERLGLKLFLQTQHYLCIQK
jgi:RimJ/RimL family protein N-acetyltransferase